MAKQIGSVWRRRLSFFRFSVPRLGLFVLLIGIWLGWIVQRAHVQRDAVAAIRQARGRVAYDWEWKNNSPVANARPQQPAWLVDRIGIDFFGHVIHVILTDTGSDGLLIHVGRLDGLDCLKLDGSPVTDAGLVHLNRLSNVRTMSLQCTKVAGAGLAHLRCLL